MTCCGCDIEEIDRFEGKSESFLRKIFTGAEIAYCHARARPAQHFAARFCAKEAVVKALANLGVSGVHYRDIEIVKDGEIPRVDLAGFEVCISLSHAAGMAMAIATVCRK